MYLNNQKKKVNIAKTTQKKKIAKKTEWKFSGMKSKVHKVGVHFDKHSQYMGNWSGSDTSDYESEFILTSVKSPNQDIEVRPRSQIRKSMKRASNRSSAPADMAFLTRSRNRNSLTSRLSVTSYPTAPPTNTSPLQSPRYATQPSQPVQTRQTPVFYTSDFANLSIASPNYNAQSPQNTHHSRSLSSGNNSPVPLHRSTSMPTNVNQMELYEYDNNSYSQHQPHQTSSNAFSTDELDALLDPSFSSPPSNTNNFNHNPSNTNTPPPQHQHQHHIRRLSYSDETSMNREQNNNSLSSLYSQSPNDSPQSVYSNPSLNNNSHMYFYDQSMYHQGSIHSQSDPNALSHFGNNNNGNNLSPTQMDYQQQHPNYSPFIQRPSM